MKTLTLLIFGLLFNISQTFAQFKIEPSTDPVKYYSEKFSDLAKKYPMYYLVYNTDTSHSGAYITFLSSPDQIEEKLDQGSADFFIRDDGKKVTARVQNMQDGRIVTIVTTDSSNFFIVDVYYWNDLEYDSSKVFHCLVNKYGKVDPSFSCSGCIDQEKMKKQDEEIEREAKVTGEHLFGVWLYKSEKYYHYQKMVDELIAVFKKQ